MLVKSKNSRQFVNSLFAKTCSGFLVRTSKQREHFVAGFIGIQFITVYSLDSAIRILFYGIMPIYRWAYLNPEGYI